MCYNNQPLTKGDFVMKVLNMSSNSFNELRSFSLPSNVFKNEGDLFIFEENGNKHLIKKLHKHYII